MSRYIYTAKTAPSQIIQGNIEADSQIAAINKLTEMGYFPVSVEEEDLTGKKSDSLGMRKISNKDIASFTGQLSNLIGSGVNIISGLKIISGQASNKHLKAVLNNVVSEIEGGRPLSESLALYPHLFSGLYTSMIRSGEIGGNLQEALKRLASFLEEEEEFKSSVWQALAYPAFVFFVGALTILILVGFVIPRLVSMFEDMGQALPMPTRVLIGLSSALRNYWWLILAFIFICAFFLHRSCRNPAFRLRLDTLKLKAVIAGDIILKTEVSRLMRTLSLLLSGGMPIVYSLDTSISLLQNQAIKAHVESFKERISNGESLSDCLKESKLFSPFVTNIVRIGEETGALEKSLMNIAETYEKEVSRLLKTLTRLLEPVIILIMGLIVGFIVLSMLLPIFQINIIVR